MRLWSSSTYFQPCTLTRPPVGAKTDSNSGGSICHRRQRVGGASYRARNRSIRLSKKSLIASPRDSLLDGVLVRWRRVACWRDRYVFVRPIRCFMTPFARHASSIATVSRRALRNRGCCARFAHAARGARAARASAAAIQKETYQNSPF